MKKYTHIQRLSWFFVASIALWGILLFASTDLWTRLTTNLSLAERTFFVFLTFIPIFILVGIDAILSIPSVRRGRLKWGAVAIAALGATISLATFDSTKIIPTILIGGATLATMGWFVQYINSRDLHRRQHTLNVLLQFRNSVEFNKHEHNILQRYPIGIDIIEIDMEGLSKEIRQSKYYKRNDSKDPETPTPVLLSIRHVLNYYEFISAAIRAGDLDKDLIRNTLEGIMSGFFKKAKIVIKHYYQQDHENYEHYRWLVTHWTDEAKDSYWDPRIWHHD